MNQLTLTGNDLSTICRLCLTSDESMTDLFCFSIKFGESVADALMKCAPVQITKNEKMPKFICQLCYNQLENVHKFQTQAAQSERTLLQYLQQLDTSDRQTSPGCSIKISSDNFVNQNFGADVAVKIEVVEPNDNLIEDNYQNTTESSHEQSDFFEEIFLKTEKDCDVQIKQEYTETSPKEISKVNVNEYISENFENQHSIEETKSVHKYEDKNKKSRNSVKKMHQCDFCNKNFRQLCHLNTHRRIHTDEKPYQCDVCNKRFKQLHSLNCHKLIHTGEKPYQCDVCNKCFTQSSHLKCHKVRHSGIKPYQCDVCDMRFVESRYLKYHKRTHTDDKPYQCDVCNKRFIQLDSLNKHKLIHTGEKPYQCDVCNKCFTQSGHLKSHKLTHSGVKPYQCDVCDMCFVQPRYLKYHMRVHTKEKRYKCDVCNKCFIHLNSLNRHKSTHTDEKTLQFDFCEVESKSNH